MYDDSALKFLPLSTSVPLLVDHDEGRAIGVVNSLSRLKWTDGPWLMADATVTDPPAWLKRHTPASFAYVLPRKCSFGNDILRSAYVTEVSVLSLVRAHAEPLAEVLTFNPTEKPRPKQAASRHQAAVGETVFYGGGPYADAAAVARRIRPVDETDEIAAAPGLVLRARRTHGTDHGEHAARTRGG